MRQLVAVVLLLGALTGCGAEGGGDADDGPSPTPSRSDALLLDFETGLQVGTEATTVENAGTADIDVRASGPGRIEVVEAPGAGHAVRFPRYTGAAGTPAVVLVAADAGGEALDPGDDDFTFGASFELDEKSSGSKTDDGDNLVQRGTFNSPGQFKIQIDHGVPSCRVLGDDGEVFVQAEAPVEPGSWYTVTCERRSAEVTLTVEGERGEGEGTWSKSGPTGTITLQGLPLTIGGKAGPDGKPVASADQFNGAVDDVFLAVG